jgi:Flp pilus assembly protein TadD/DNA polymerase III delta prime subunit
MANLIQQLSQLIAEDLQAAPHASIAELVERLKHDDRIIQINSGNATAFQTLVEEGGIANVGVHLHDFDEEKLDQVLKAFWKSLQPAGIPNHLPRTHVEAFVGRSQELEQLHQQLQQGSRLAITAISGMGGIGKTELALQYARHHLEQETYPGGVCWLRAREAEVGPQIVSFARSWLGLQVPEGLDLQEQIDWCWQHWREGAVLLILDDVTDYAKVEDYLPSADRFKLLITTRLQLGKSFHQLEIEVLEETAALELLRALTDAERIDRQLEAAKQLCQWLGYLPLGLELVGRYLEREPDLSLSDLLSRLETEKLQQVSLIRDEADPTWASTAQRGVMAAFELSWKELKPSAQYLGYLLSWFGLAPISWLLVRQVRDAYYVQPPETFWNKLKTRLGMGKKQSVEDWLNLQTDAQLEEARAALVRLSLLQRSREHTYLLHQLIREFFQAKSIAHPHPEVVDRLKRSICRVMAEISRTIPQTPTLTEIAQLTPAIPHLESAAQHLTDFYSDEDVLWAFTGVDYFYRGQGQYQQAEPWCVAARDIASQRFDAHHPDVARSLNNLAELYRAQGCYGEAEPLYVRSLSIKEQQLGANHPSVATSLDNLALLYDSQGRYKEAEPLCIRALLIREQQLGTNHLDVAISLNNLAALYEAQGRYSEAEPLCVRALSIREQQLGADHLDVATSLNNLAELYKSQGRYGEAELLLVRSLLINEKQLGANHPLVAFSCNNLAELYDAQGRYGEAEPLYVRSLSILEQQLGANHPDIAPSLNNLAELYRVQGRYGEAELLLVRSLLINEKQLGANHPLVAFSLNNLALLYRAQRRYREAEPLYVRALGILFNSLGETHPNTQTGWANFSYFLQQVIEAGQTEQLSDNSFTQWAIEQLRQPSGEMEE